MAALLARILPPQVSERLQAYMFLVGIAGMIVAPFLSTAVAVIVINEVSFLTLSITGLAGVDAARTGETNGERN